MTAGLAAPSGFELARGERAAHRGVQVALEVIRPGGEALEPVRSRSRSVEELATGDEVCRPRITIDGDVVEDAGVPILHVDHDGPAGCNHQFRRLERDVA